MNSQSGGLWGCWHSLSLVRSNGKVHQKALLFGCLHRCTEQWLIGSRTIPKFGPVSGGRSELIIWQKLETASANVGHCVDILPHHIGVSACVWKPEKM